MDGYINLTIQPTNTIFVKIYSGDGIEKATIFIPAGVYQMIVVRASERITWEVYKEENE